MSPKAFSLIASVIALLVGMFAFAVVPATAAAQSPAICDEYPNLPECVEDDRNDRDDDNGGPGAAGPSGEANAGGELPFTGYPLNPLILILLVLLALGLATRMYVAIRDRFQTTGSHDGYS